MHRRELLAAFLGAPAALAIGGCQGNKPLPIPPGELTGPSVDFGHRIRDSLRANQSPDSTETVERDVVVIGSGIAGLSAARRLQAEGVENFSVLELEKEPGGKSRNGSKGKVQFPWGAHYVPAPRKENAPLVQFFDELGAFEGFDDDGHPIPQEHWRVRDPESRVCFKGVWYEGLYLNAGADDNELAQRAKFDSLIDQWVAFRGDDGRPAFTIPSSKSSRDKRATDLDRISMADWLEQHELNSPRLLWYVDYACRDDYGMNADTTSAWAGIFYFAARKATPGGGSQPFMTWPAGNGMLVQKMFQPLRDRTELGWAAVRVGASPQDNADSNEQSARVPVIALSQDGRKRRFLAKHVIYAAPRFLAPYLIPSMPKALREASSEFQYSSWVVANLHLTQHPKQSDGFPICWDNVLYESPSLGYVLATHQHGPHQGPTVLTYYYPLCGADPKAERERLLGTSREEWAEIALSDLEAGHPDIRSICERIDVCRWGHAMVRPTLGFIHGEARAMATKPMGRVHFAHSDLSGIPLFEEAFDHGWRAAGEVVSAIAAEANA